MAHPDTVRRAVRWWAETNDAWKNGVTPSQQDLTAMLMERLKQ